MGTNPEELIAAAHSSCFTMKLTFLLEEKGFIPEHMETSAKVTLAKEGISHSHLKVRAKIPGITEDVFRNCALDAKENCPVSKALKLHITMEAELEEEVMSH